MKKLFSFLSLFIFITTFLFYFSDTVYAEKKPTNLKASPLPCNSFGQNVGQKFTWTNPDEKTFQEGGWTYELKETWIHVFGPDEFIDQPATSGIEIKFPFVNKKVYRAWVESVYYHDKVKKTFSSGNYYFSASCSIPPTKAPPAGGGNLPSCTSFGAGYFCATSSKACLDGNGKTASTIGNCNSGICCSKSGGSGTNPPPVGGTAPPAPPPASGSKPSIPTGLSQSTSCSGSTGTAKLTWNSVSGASSYIITEYAGDGKTWNKIGEVNTNNFEWKNLKSGTGYTWGVEAVNSAGKSGLAYKGFTAPNCSSAPPPTSGTVKVTLEGKISGTNSWSSSGVYGEKGFQYKLRAKVSGTATGEITYEFMCRQSSGVIVKKITTSSTSYEFDDTCQYYSKNSAESAYVKATRGGKEDSDTLPLALTTNSNPPTQAPNKPGDPQGPEGYTFCAEERKKCSFEGSANVAFGIDGKWKYKGYTDGASCTVGAFGDPAVGIKKNCFYRSVSGSSNGPTGYTFCAKERNTCKFSGTAMVAYGANDKFNYKTFSNSTPCSNSVFGDPLRGITKSCFYKSSSGGVPGQDPDSQPPPDEDPDSQPPPDQEEEPEVASYITGKIFIDSNSNGKYDKGEQGYNSVSQSLVYLELPGGTSYSFLMGAQTDNNGNYSFDNLKKGNYTISVVAPQGYTLTRNRIGLKIPPNRSVSFGIRPL